MIDSSGVARNNNAAAEKASSDGHPHTPAAGGCCRARTCAELLCKLPSEVEGDSSEVGVP